MFEQRAPASIDQLLDAFARETSLARHPAMHDRVRVVRAWLSVYLLAGVEPLLTSAEAVRLQAARRFEPSRFIT